jgi:hypothetical protein
MKNVLLFARPHGACATTLDEKANRIQPTHCFCRTAGSLRGYAHRPGSQFGMQGEIAHDSERVAGVPFSAEPAALGAMENSMALFDNIESNLDAIAGKVGLPPHEVREIANSVQANLTSSEGNPESAIEAAAAQHDVPIETIQKILNLGGGLESELGDFASTLFKP